MGTIFVENILQTREEKIRKRKTPEELFFSSMKSEATKKAYSSYIQRFMRFVGCSTVNDLIMVTNDSTGVQTTARNHIEDLIIDFIIDLKEKESMSFRAIDNYLCPVISFYKINDVMLNTKKINQFMPPKIRLKKNRGYTHEEIQRMLNIADERMRAVILLLVSSGCRIGSIPGLHVRDLERKENENLYKVTIYENDVEEYFTFTTPEAADALDQYLDMRKRFGEKINPDSPLIREQFDTRDPFSIAAPKTVKSSTLAGKLAQLAERAGIREKRLLKEGEKFGSVRKAVPIVHGFRKSFSTFAHSAKMDTIVRMRLEGHSVGISDHYVLPPDQEFLEEYVRAVDNLTIDPTKRMARKIEKLEVQKSQWDQLAAKIASLEQKIR